MNYSIESQYGMSKDRRDELVDTAKIHLGLICIELSDFLQQLRHVKVDSLGEPVVLHPAPGIVFGQQQFEFENNKE